MSLFEKILSTIVELGGAEATRGSRRAIALRQLGPDFDKWCEFLDQLPDELDALRVEYSRAFAQTTNAQPVIPTDPLSPVPSLGLWGEEQLIRDLAADLDLDHRAALQNLAVAIREARDLVDSLVLRTADSVPRGDGKSHPLSGYAVPVNYVDQLNGAVATASQLRDRMRVTTGVRRIHFYRNHRDPVIHPVVS